MIQNFNFFAEQLMHPTTVKVVLPDDGNIEYSMYFLHGSYCDAQNCLDNMDTEAMANKYNMAIIIPDCGNFFYIDQGMPVGNYGKFVGRELVEITRRKFNLPKEREKTIIAGFSMGGYGAIRNGLINSKRFGHIIALSGAFLFENNVNTLEGTRYAYMKKNLFDSQFGEYSLPGNHDKDYRFLINKLIEENKDIPKIYMTAGIEEILAPLSDEFGKYLDTLDVDFKYEKFCGGHDWEFWKERIEPAIDWCIR